MTKRARWVLLILVASGGVLLIAASRWGSPLFPPSASVFWLWVERVAWLAGLATLVIALLTRPGRRWITSGAIPGWQTDSPAGVSLAVPLPRSPVHGRDAMVRRLLKLFPWHGGRLPRVWVLHGMGGCGKTTLAAQAALLLAHRRVRVWWVSAASPAELLGGFREIAVRLGAGRDEVATVWDQGIGSAVDYCWRLLGEARHRWLLVIDNADYPQLLAPVDGEVAAARGWLRPVVSRRGAVIVTSRVGDARTWGAWCHLQPVGMLPAAYGARVLLDGAGAGAGSVADAEALATRLGGLPLALHVAGSYLGMVRRHPVAGARLTFAAYRAGMESGLVVELLDRPIRTPLTPAHARHIVTYTWEYSLDLLERTGHQWARDLLRLLSVFADAPIPTSLLLDPEALATLPPFAGITRRALIEHLDALANHGLLEVATASTDRDSAVVALHPLVSEVSRHHADIGGKLVDYLTVAVALADRCSMTLDGSRGISTWPSWQSISPHVFQLLRTASACHEPSDALVRSVSRTAVRAAMYTYGAGYYTETLANLNTLMRLQETRLGQHDALILNTRYWMGRTLLALSEYEAAEQHMRAIIDAQLRSPTQDGPDVLITRHWLGWLLQAQGDLKEADAHFLEVIAARTAGPERRERNAGWLLAARRKRATVLGERGDLAAAESELREVLQAQLELAGAEDHSVWLTSLELAGILHHRGNYSESETILRRVLDAQLRVYERADHPDTLHVRHQLAMVRGTTGHYRETATELDEIIAAYRRVYGDLGARTLRCRHLRGRMWYELGHLDKAEAEFEALVAAATGRHDRNSCTIVVHARMMRAIVWHAQGKLDAALEELLALAEPFARLLNTPRSLLHLRYWTGRAQLSTGEVDTAIATLRAVADHEERLYGDRHHPNLLATEHWIAIAAYRKGDHDLAVSQLQEVLRARRQRLGEQHPRTKETLESLNLMSPNRTRPATGSGTPG